jgi:hypothetical protein
MSFSVSKKIKIAGVGLYGSHEGKTFSGTLRIVEGGTTVTGNVIYEESAEIPPAPSQENCITTMMFKKPVRIKPCVDYTIEFSSTTVGYVYYGCGGKPTIDGEKGVVFEFKYLNGSSYSTGSESGLFPEIYYLV